MKKPKIRFKGYTDAWEQRKLNEIAKKVTEKNKDNLYDEPLTNSAEQGIISQKDYFDREVVNEENLDGYYVVQDNDFVYNPRVSVTAPVGPINRNKLGRNGVMSPLYTVFRTHDIDTCYLEYYFKTTSWHRFMKLNGDSGARFDRFSIASSLFMEMPIPYPCMDEQERIGEYFQYLDNLITLHQRKCEETKKLKKYMLQKMFPKDGESVPEIRFSGFTNAWEQRKFGETVLIERGGSPRPIDKFITNDENGLNWVKIGDAPEQGNYITQTAEKIKPEGLKKTRQVFPGDLILSNSMSFGRPYIMGIEGCIHDGWLLIRDTNNSYDLKFLCVLLGSDQMFNQYKAFAAGSTVNNLNKELVGNTLVSVPTLEEQVKLGEYFSRIDHLITLHQRKCEELQNMKKFMLQNMFA